MTHDERVAAAQAAFETDKYPPVIRGKFVLTSRLTQNRPYRVNTEDGPVGISEDEKDRLMAAVFADLPDDPQ